MLLIIGGTKVRVSEKKLHILGDGQEGIVYSYNGNALKLYHNGPYAYRKQKKKLDLEGCHYLQNIITHCFTFPKEAVLDKHRHLRGYISNLVENEKDIYQCKCSLFLQECACLKEDILTLTESFVEIDDICLQNFIFNGKMNFVDPGSFFVHFNLLKNNEYPVNLEAINMERINSFIRREIIQTKCSSLLPRDKEYSYFFEKFREDFCSHLDESVFIGESLEKMMHPNDTVDEFITSYVKKKTL